MIDHPEKPVALPRMNGTGPLVDMFNATMDSLNRQEPVAIPPVDGIQDGVLEAWAIWNNIEGGTPFDELDDHLKALWVQTLSTYAAHVTRAKDIEIARLESYNRLLCNAIGGRQ